MNDTAENLHYDDQVAINNSLESQSLTVGMQLKQAREAKGLSIEDIAAELRLIKANVLDIENSEYKRRIPITFYRGYIRAYAKFLGLPDVELIEAFNVETPVVQRQAQEQALPKNNQVRKFLFTEKQVKRVIWALMGIGLLSYFFLPHSQTQSDKSKQLVQDGKTTVLSLEKPMEKKEHARLG